MLHSHPYSTAYIEGSQEQPVCVMLHGLFGSSSNLLSVAKNLSAVCSPILYDLPNHGKSPTLEPCSFLDMAEMLKNSITQDVKTDKIHILGHSLGGKLAMVLALMYPEIVSSVVIMDIAPVTYPPFHKDIIEGLYKVLSQPISSKKEIVQTLSNYTANVLEAEFIAKSLAYNEDGTIDSDIRVKEIHNNYDILRSFPFEEMQGKVYSEDVLLLTAKETEYFQDSYYQDIERYFPSWELEEVPESGHNIHVDNFKYTMQAIVSFYEYILS